MEQKLESLHIDLESEIAKVEVNGKDISAIGSYLNLTFENGDWSLMIKKDEFYTTSNHNSKE